jgi:hypothetical protein
VLDFLLSTFLSQIEIIENVKKRKQSSIAKNAEIVKFVDV